MNAHRALIVEAPGVATVREVAPTTGPVALRTLATGVSAGTELTFLNGTNPALCRHFDAELGLFVDGPGVGYPVTRLGYMEVAQVESDTSALGLAPGTLVAAAYGHRTHHGLDPRTERIVVLAGPTDAAVSPSSSVSPSVSPSPSPSPSPSVSSSVSPPVAATGSGPGDLRAISGDGRPGSGKAAPRASHWTGLDPLLGVLVAHMGPICANGLLHAAAYTVGPAVRDLGDGVRGRRIAVVGGGTVGLLTGLLARHHGAAEVVVLDPTPARRAAAHGLGLDALDPDAGDPAPLLKTRWRHGPGDRGADVVFQCRGRSAALATALRLARPQASVIDLAFYADDAAGVALGAEFHHNGLAVVCAQIGRVPRGLAPVWDRERLSVETVVLLAEHGTAIRRHVLTDVLPLDEGPALLADLAARRRHVIQAVLTC